MRNRTMKIIAFTAVFLYLSICVAFGEDNARSTALSITVGNKVLSAVMDDNPTAEHFISQLPLRIRMKDLGRVEKYGYATEKLIVDGSAGYYDPEPGDICCYIPWGNVCIYYDDHGEERLVRIGKLEEGGAAVLSSLPGEVSVLFEVKK